MVYLRHRGLCGSEAVSCGIVATLALYSLVLQLGFTLGLPTLSAALEIALVAISLATAVRLRATLERLSRAILRGTRHRLPLVILTGAGAYLLAQALVLPPSNWDSFVYNLSRVVLMDRERTLFLDHYTSIHQAVFPAGGDILAWLFLRTRSDYFVGIFSWLSWVAIVAGSWSLACRVAPQSARAVVLVIAGLPELVYQSTSTKPDILAAAAAIAAVQAGFRLYERLSIHDLLLAGAALAFGLTSKTTFSAFLIPFAVAWVRTIFRRHRGSRSQHFGFHGLLLRSFVPASLLIVLSGMPLLVRNQLRWGSPLGPTELTEPYRNADGLRGALANTTRYVFQSVDLLPPTDALARVLTGYVSDLLRRAYETALQPALGDAGMVRDPYRRPFHIYWRAHEDHSWFGPALILLLAPALVHSLRWGDCRVKTTAWTIVLHRDAQRRDRWMSWNSRFFSLLVACAAPLLAIGQELALCAPRSRWSLDETPRFPFQCREIASLTCRRGMQLLRQFGTDREHYAGRFAVD